MKQYHDLVRRILNEGVTKGDRTGTGTRSVFGHQMRFDMGDGFPLVTTKKTHLKSVIYELLWFLKGDTNIKYLNDNGVTIWDEWADESGELGPVYGKQWRSWTRHTFEEDPEGRHAGYHHEDTVDQIQWVIDAIKRNPDSRRLVVSAWNVADLDQMALAPCHCLFQFNTRPFTAEQRYNWYYYRMKDVALPEEWRTCTPERRWSILSEIGVPTRYLDLQLYQRSADVFLGVPFNIASYALLLHMVAKMTYLVPGEFIWSGGDCHLYANHFEQAQTLLRRPPRSLPKLMIADGPSSIFEITYNDIVVADYDPHPAIKAEVAV